MEKHNIEELKEWTEMELNKLATEAEEQSKIFWYIRDKSIEEKTGIKRPRIGCRVQKEENMLAINWFYHVFYKDPTTHKMRRTNERIKKPKGSYSYNVNKLLKYSVPSIDETVIYSEKKFAVIRNKLEKLRKLKIWINSYENVLEAEDDEDDNKQQYDKTAEPHDNVEQTDSDTDYTEVTES